MHLSDIGPPPPPTGTGCRLNAMYGTYNSIFEFFAYRIEGSNAESDGAFVAELNAYRWRTKAGKVYFPAKPMVSSHCASFCAPALCVYMSVPRTSKSQVSNGTATGTTQSGSSRKKTCSSSSCTLYSRSHLFRRCLVF